MNCGPQPGSFKTIEALSYKSCSFEAPTMIEFVGQYYILPLHFVFNACNFLSFILINFLNSGGFYYTGPTI